MSTAETGALVTPQEEPEILKQINEAMSKNIDASEMVISRVAILQPNSPEIAESVPGYKAGMLVDSQTREILTINIKPPWLVGQVDESELRPIPIMPFVNVFKLPTEFIKWIPRNEREAFRAAHPDHKFDWEWKSLDRNDPRVREGVWPALGGTFAGRKPPVTDNSNHLILPLNMQEKLPLSNFMVQTFSRTSAPTGKTMTSHIASLKMQNLRAWDRVFYLYTTQEKNNDGTFFVTRLAKGPLTKDCVQSFVLDQILSMARALSEPTSGPMLQTILINSAHLGGEHGTDESSASGGVSTGNQDDPFAPDAAGSAVEGKAAEPAKQF